MRAALELMPQLVWTTTPDGYHDYYNQRWYDFTGMPRPDDPNADAEGWNWNKYLHPDDYARTVEAWSHCLRTGEPYQIEYRFKEKASGAYRWFLGRALPLRDVEGRIVRWFGTCTDIHDGKVTLDRLLESEERFRNSTHYSAIGHALVGLEGQCLQANPALARILGRSEQSLVGLRFQDVTHPDDLARDLDEFRRLACGEIDSYQMDKRYVQASGNVVWAQLIVSSVRKGSGTPLYFIAQLQDLTERHTLERQLREAHKLEAVGRLAGGVAHDFNNLLAVILGYTQILLADTSDPRTVADLEGIRTATERGARLTSQLLTFGRRHLRRVTEVDLGAVVEEAAGLVRQLAGPHIHVLVDSQPDTFVRLDPSEFDQILINLVVNARDAMPSGGSLHVTVVGCELSGAGELDRMVNALPPGPYVQLTVTDTGCGIPSDVIPRIFEPFFSTKEGSGGGLGLATIYGIVTQSGGTIRVESEVDGGTRMSVLLPRDTTARSAIEPSPAEVPDHALGCTVLLVEDERELRDVCRRILERAGHAVIVARHGNDGLEAWTRHRTEIDVVVTDLVMPELGGRELVDAIRQSRPDIPVVFMSGYTDDDIMRRQLDEPGTTFLAKPFEPKALLLAIKECMRRGAEHHG
ncbi:MAG: PAS domain S-box protein [Gemmatimonadaceae bacterium]